jgi:NADPH:quinone reductase-like Zn-dependent oxidoreductase
MRAIILKKPGITDNFQYCEIPRPDIEAGEVLVKVHSISINPVDVKTRLGGGAFLYADLSQEKEIILGWDISGTITASESPLFKVGDDVFGMVNFPHLGRAYAEYVAVAAEQLVLKPSTITHEEAAGATLALLTAWQHLVEHAKVKAGERVLINAASGGVGHYAVQIAKYLGAYVIGTSSAANRDFILALGADEHIDYQTQILNEATGDIDVVLAAMGKEDIRKAIEVTKSGGRVVSIVSQFTGELRTLADGKSITGDFYPVHLSSTDMQKLANFLDEGTLKSVVSKVFSFDQMAEAHQHIESGRTVGKIVVNV